MSDETIRELLEVQAFFRLPSIGLVEKDLHVVRAIRALTTVDAAPFDLVFGGGTALARAHRIVRRMSEDVDFKIVPRAAAPVSRSGLQRQLDHLRKRVSAALLDTGFVFDPADKSIAWARDEGRYAVWQLPYRSESGAGEGLRPAIIYDLHMMRGLIDPAEIAVLARGIAETDAEEFHNQYPAYAADIACETKKALEALRADPVHRRRYDDFVAAMVYGERPSFDEAFATVGGLAQEAWLSQGN